MRKMYRKNSNLVESYLGEIKTIKDQIKHESELDFPRMPDFSKTRDILKNKISQRIDKLVERVKDNSSDEKIVKEVLDKLKSYRDMLVDQRTRQVLDMNKYNKYL